MKKTLYSDITIAASPTAIWTVLTDLTRYRDWNPFITRLEGDLAIGNQLRGELALGERTIVFRPRVVRVTAQRELRWIGRFGVAGLFDGEHSLAIERNDDGTTCFVQQETFSGILVPFLWLYVKRRTQSGFKSMNTQLKKRAESL